MTQDLTGLALARSVLDTEAAAIRGVRDQLDERFTRAVQVLR